MSGNDYGRCECGAVYLYEEGKKCGCLTEVDVLREALENIQTACNHEWLTDVSESNHKARMFMACVKDCRRISRQALKETA